MKKRTIAYIGLLACCCWGMTACSKAGREADLSKRKKKQISKVQPDTAQPTAITDVPAPVPAQERQGAVIPMRKEGGVYTIPVEVNGIQMRMIFDTGASDVTISEKEAKLLFDQGLLTEEDVLGTGRYSIADGSIVEGTQINLRSVRLGGKEVRNIAASVMHSQQAPLLLGQSVLSRFGSISVDYQKQELTLK